jgi:hypothetical protein
MKLDRRKSDETEAIQMKLDRRKSDEVEMMQVR